MHISLTPVVELKFQHTKKKILHKGIFLKSISIRENPPLVPFHLLLLHGVPPHHHSTPS